MESLSSLPAVSNSQSLESEAATATSGSEKRRQPQFGRIPAAVVFAGGLACATRAELAVYLILCSHANMAWQSRPSIERIAELAGLTRRAVCRAADRLQLKGLIVKTSKGGGRGLCSEYRLETNSERGVTVSAAETVNKPARKQGKNKRENSERAVTPTDTRTDTTTNRLAAAAGDDAEPRNGDTAVAELRRRFVAAGISRKVASGLAVELSGLPDVSERVGQVLAEAGNRTGLAVTMLRGLAEQLQAEAEERQRQSDVRRRKAEAEEAERQRQAAAAARRTAERQAFIGSLTDGEFDTAVADIIAEANAFIRPKYERDMSRNNGMLADAVFHRLNRNGQATATASRN